MTNFMWDADFLSKLRDAMEFFKKSGCDGDALLARRQLMLAHPHLVDEWLEEFYRIEHDAENKK